MTAYMNHKDLANEIIDQSRAQEITDGVHRVLDRIAAAESMAGREAGSVQLLAATKTRDVGEIMAAIGAGIHLIGENRPQEVTVKAPGLTRLLSERGMSLGVIGEAGAFNGAAASGAANGVGDSDSTGASANAANHIPFHLIGQLQANKIGKVLPVVNTIESVDSATMRGITVGVLLEVNESGEESKSGCAPSHAIDLAQRIGAMGGLELQGLMTIGAHVDDERAIRAGFAHLRRTRDQILASGAEGTASCKELSMGMTHDMAYAIEEGSTIVRVGTAIFGERAFI